MSGEPLIDYVDFKGPPPIGTTMEDTYGTIMSHSGELRTSDADFSLPSPRMPINIIRAERSESMISSD